MIEIIKESTTVNFAEDLNDAKIVISVKGTIVCLQEVAIKGMKVGVDHPTEEQIKPLPNVNLSFSNEKSVDLLIRALEVIKNNLRLHTFALAC